MGQVGTSPLTVDQNAHPVGGEKVPVSMWYATTTVVVDTLGTLG